MDSSKQNIKLKEQISALVDGECELHELELTISSLKMKESRDEWEIYHQIGDMLNSQELNIHLSTEFTAKLQARINAEPIHLRPAKKLSHFNTRTAYALAAMLALAIVLLPRFAGHEGSEVDAPYQSAQFLSVTNGSPSNATIIAASAARTSTTPSTNQHPESDVRMLRDPLIDSYLAAHQRYSNPMYSEVEYETSPINQEAGR